MRGVTKRLFSLGSYRTVLRFEQQNQNWTLGDLEKHSGAFAYGVESLGQVTNNQGPQKSKKLIFEIKIYKN